MDRRVCPSYEAGFDTCDPFAPVLEARTAAKVLRRRCRSEGIERSPYEDASRDQIPVDVLVRHNSRGVPNKSHFTLNSYSDDPRRDRLLHECHQPAPENGDYHMAHELKRLFGLVLLDFFPIASSLASY